MRAIAVEEPFQEAEDHLVGRGAIACPLGAMGDVMPSRKAEPDAIKVALKTLPLAMDNFVRSKYSWKYNESLD